MGIEVNTEDREVLHTINKTLTMEELPIMLDILKPTFDVRVGEIMEPNQSLETTRTELKDLLLQLHTHQAVLAEHDYGADEQELIRDAYIAFSTVHELFSVDLRLGDYRTRTVAEVVKASKPWRDKLRKKAAHAFFFAPNIQASFQDHNTTGTLDEEVADLRALVAAAATHQDALTKKGFTPADRVEGERLLAEAEGRNITALIGIRTQAERKLLRDRLLTLTINLARYARAAGLSAFHDDPAISARFERFSFRDAMRRLKRTSNAPQAPAGDAPSEPAPQA